jgi:hypothetical protein
VREAAAKIVRHPQAILEGASIRFQRCRPPSPVGGSDS